MKNHPVLRTQKIIQSEINLAKARLHQIKTSSLFSVEETKKQEETLNNQIEKLAQELEVFDAEIIK